MMGKESTQNKLMTIPMVEGSLLTCYIYNKGLHQLTLTLTWFQKLMEIWFVLEHPFFGGSIVLGSLPLTILSGGTFINMLKEWYILFSIFSSQLLGCQTIKENNTNHTHARWQQTTTHCELKNIKLNQIKSN